MTIKHSQRYVPLRERSLSDHVVYWGPARFSQQDVLRQEWLFEQRAALFHTPSSAMPKHFIGDGPLDVVLPLLPTTRVGELEIRSYNSPRLWTDLLQLATGKLRWRHARWSHVVVTRYSPSFRARHDLWDGMKPVLDALKHRTTGRSDGQPLYYFGAIHDDDPSSIESDMRHERVTNHFESRTRIQVIALDAPLSDQTLHQINPARCCLT